MAFGPLILGTAMPRCVRRGWRQSIAAGVSAPGGGAYSLELAELITGRIPWVQSVRFVNSGTEA